ncbi:MAG: SufD family Fe-S cluster assembly protein [Actinomycetota bacterium]
MTKLPKWRRESIKRAEAAREKRAKLGPDVDIDKFEREAPNHPTVSTPGELPQEIQEAARMVGIDSNEAMRLGTFFQCDHSVIVARTQKGIPGVEIMGMNQALEEYDWLADYWWKAVPVDMDKYTAMAEINQTEGYFIRTEPGARLTLPVQACLFMGSYGILQCPHNVVIAEEDSELHIITGCTIHPSVDFGMHIGVSEFYIKKGATITFTMIHGWAPKIEVRPRTGAVIERGGTFLSNYVCFRPVKTLQMYPVAYCQGDDSKARYHTLIYGCRDSFIDVGNRAVLKARGAKAEVTTRAIARDSSQIIARGHLVGERTETRAHLDCRGLLLSEKARIHAIPELEGKVEGCDLSHEAAVGKIEEEQLYYLMSRGLNEEQATSLIVRGFLDPEIPDLPDHLKREIRRIVQLTAEKVL